MKDRDIPNRNHRKSKNHTSHNSATESEFCVHQAIQAVLKQQGYSKPTEIQKLCIQPLIEGRDLIGIAQTGTGKTGAFLIPLIERFWNEPPNDQVLIVLPTRELALQVEKELQTLSDGLRIRSACFVGGTNINTDLKKMQRSHHVVIATPGRLLDLNQRGAIELAKFSTLILDEFDRLLDMGFKRDIQKIVSEMKGRQHTALFSATEEKSQKALIRSIVKNPVRVEVKPAGTKATMVSEEFVKIDEPGKKFKKLLEILNDQNVVKTLVFAETKRGVSRLSRRLNREGLKAVEIHGDRSQNQRIKALSQFKSGSAKILVATDVAARGIHVDDISHVVNYQEPNNPDSYIHRIGRTGRAGKSGTAYTFVS